MDANQIYISMEVRRYSQSLVAWSSQVIAASTTLGAFRLATRPPAESGILTACRSMTRSDKNRAQQRIETDLERRLMKMTPEDVKREQHVLMRCTQGHFPKLYLQIERILRTTNSD